MPRHRLFQQHRAATMPRAQLPELRAGAFMLCPVFLSQTISCQMLAWQIHIYQAAFREALAVVRPSLPERDLAGVWN